MASKAKVAAYLRDLELKRSTAEQFDRDFKNKSTTMTAEHQAAVEKIEAAARALHPRSLTAAAVARASEEVTRRVMTEAHLDLERAPDAPLCPPSPSDIYPPAEDLEEDAAALAKVKALHAGIKRVREALSVPDSLELFTPVRPTKTKTAPSAPKTKLIGSMDSN